MMKHRTRMLCVWRKIKREPVLRSRRKICRCWARTPLWSSTVKCWKSRVMNRKPLLCLMHCPAGSIIVMTAVAFADRRDCLSTLVVTDVTFRSLSADDIAHYILSGEPMDKAGAYGIQGKGGCFVREIRGSYYAVVGLPLVETQELLNEFAALRELRRKHDS